MSAPQGVESKHRRCEFVCGDPHEDLNVFGLFPFVAEPALKVVEEYLSSVKEYPNPPAPNVTQFQSSAR